MRLEIEILDFPIEGKCWGRGKRGGVGKKGTGLDWLIGRTGLKRGTVSGDVSADVKSTPLIQER